MSARFGHPDGGFRRRAHHRQVLEEGGGRGRGRQLEEPRHGQGDHGAEEHPQAADAPQHHCFHHRRVQPARHHPLAGDADRRGPLHGRLHLLSRGPTTPSTRSRLDTKELVQQLVGIEDFKAADFLLDGRSLEPTRGKKETTDHPPIYPTQAVNPHRLEARSEAHRQVYELVARRFLATFSPPMVTESTRANIETAQGTPRLSPGRPTSFAARSCWIRAMRPSTRTLAPPTPRSPSSRRARSSTSRGSRWRARRPRRRPGSARAS